jgi:plasmid stability protein
MTASPGGLIARCRHWQHNTAIASITIRDVPDDVRDELASRAARASRSLQEHMRTELIELARRPDVGVLMERVRARKQATGSQLPAEQILAHRDSDRR